MTVRAGLNVSQVQVISADNYVDTPLFAGPHLKLLLEGYVATSVGLVIRKRDH